MGRLHNWVAFYPTSGKLFGPIQDGDKEIETGSQRGQFKGMKWGQEGLARKGKRIVH